MISQAVGRVEALRGPPQLAMMTVGRVEALARRNCCLPRNVQGGPRRLDPPYGEIVLAGTRSLLGNEIAKLHDRLPV